MRIVLDTNVALSALLWRGTPYRLLEAIRQRGDVQLISNAALLEELADVLTRPSPAKRLAVIGKSAQAVLADYVEVVEVMAPAEVPRVVPNDADDDHVIAAAVAGVGVGLQLRAVHTTRFALATCHGVHQSFSRSSGFMASRCGRLASRTCAATAERLARAAAPVVFRGMPAVRAPALGEEIGDMTSSPGTGPGASARLADPSRQPRSEPIDPSGRPDFAAIVHGVDLTRPLRADEVEAIHAAIDRYGVLVFRDQQLDDTQQVAFSRQLGPLELATGDIGEVKDRRLAMELNDISNLDKHGEVLPRDNRARLFGLGNRLWHSDSSFKAVPAKYSLLSARRIPSVGGNTEFADMRAAYDALDDETRGEIQDLVCLHSQLFSRGLLGFDDFTQAERLKWAPVRQRLVRRHPNTGRYSLYLSSHAGSIEGWPTPEARAFLRDLNEHATQRRFVYEHVWRPWDLVMWDNRVTMHRARPFRSTEVRDMRRTTLTNEVSSLEQG